jgi:hypothetical protein
MTFRSQEFVMHRHIALISFCLALALAAATPARAEVYCSAVGVPAGCVMHPDRLFRPGVGAPGAGVAPRDGGEVNRGGPVNRAGRH